MAIQFEVRKTFRSPPARVFDALADLENAGLWMQGLVRIESLTPGELRVGSEWRETRRMYGKEATEQFEVTAHEPPRRLGLRMDGAKGTTGRGEFLFTYHLEPLDDGTSLRLDAEIRGLTGVMRLIGRLLVSTFRKGCAKDLAALKRHLEKVEA